jgi:hypothetical protein
MDAQTTRPQLVFKRYEQKYILTPGQRQALAPQLAARMVPDEHGDSLITSVYLDTPTFLLARRSIEGGPYKEKLRMRCYGEPTPDTPVFVEIKKKCRGVVYKRRVASTAQGAPALLHPDSLADLEQIENECAFLFSRYDSLAPRICVTYHRQALFAADDPDFRLTLDADIRWFPWDDPDVEAWLQGGPRPEGKLLLAANKTLMEVKIAQAMPLWMAHALSEQGAFQTSFSKIAHAYRQLVGMERVPRLRPRPATSPSGRGAPVPIGDAAGRSAPAPALPAAAAVVLPRHLSPAPAHLSSTSLD